MVESLIAAAAVSPHGWPTCAGTVCGGGGDVARLTVQVDITPTFVLLMHFFILLKRMYAHTIFKAL